MAKMPEPAGPQVEEGLAAALLRMHTESYGRGARRATVHIIDDSVVCFLDELELLPNEQFMIEAGHEEAVIDMRGCFQEAIQHTFAAAVERATGRRVISFVSATKLDPNYSVELFRLGPRADVGALEEPESEKSEHDSGDEAIAEEV